MINVLMLSKKDFAGSGQHICNAARQYGINIKLIVKEKNPYNYDYDYDIKSTTRDFIQNLINKADIIHFKGDDLPTNQWNNFQINKFKPKIITCGGSGFRRNSHKSVSFNWFEFEKYINSTVFRSVLTPDLNYKEFNGQYTQHCIESENKEFTYQQRPVFTIVHSPSNRHKKGTNDIVIPALEYMKSKYKDVNCVLIENVSNVKCIELKKKASVFIDQFHAGWYGMNTLEAIQFGIPTICYLSDEALQQAGTMPKIPIINCAPTKENLINTLETLKNKNLTRIAKDTKQYCDNFHSYSVVGKMWAEIYTEIYKNNLENINFSKQNKDLDVHWDTLPDKVEVKIINNIYRGFKLTYDVNEIITLKKSLAINYLKKGIAILNI